MLVKFGKEKYKKLETGTHFKVFYKKILINFFGCLKKRFDTKGRRDKETKKNQVKFERIASTNLSEAHL